MTRNALIVLLMLAPLAGSVSGQSRQARGFVWTMPATRQAAIADILAMHEAGATAVRTGTVHDAGLFALADSLGIHFFQDLPIGYAVAESLADTLLHARRLLRDRFTYADRFESARTLGLARWLDSFDSEACRFLDELQTVVTNEAPVGTVTYYVTPFAAPGNCRGSVDLVLMDVLDVEAAAVAEDVQLRPIDGFAAVGAWVDRRSRRGWRHRRSEDGQARSIETMLSSLLSGSAAQDIVFVFEWRDSGRNGQVPAPLGRRYGLHDGGGAPRPALDVVAGLFSGSQDVFAFPAGDNDTVPPTWPAAITWIVAGLVVAAFFLSPNLRRMAPRYFRAHVFYREAVAEGRDALPSESVLLLTAVAMGAGATAALFLVRLSQSRAYALASTWMPEVVSDGLLVLLEKPLTLAVVAASLFALGFTVWSSLLSAFSRLGKAVYPGQTLMLVIWPQWHLIILAFLTIGVLSGNGRLVPFAVVACLWLILMATAMFRTVVDFIAAARVSRVVALGAILLHPVIVAAAVLVALLVRRQAEVQFLARLLE